MTNTTNGNRFAERAQMARNCLCRAVHLGSGIKPASELLISHDLGIAIIGTQIVTHRGKLDAQLSYGYNEGVLNSESKLYILTDSEKHPDVLKDPLEILARRWDSSKDRSRWAGVYPEEIDYVRRSLFYKVYEILPSRSGIDGIYEFDIGRFLDYSLPRMSALQKQYERFWPYSLNDDVLEFTHSNDDHNYKMGVPVPNTKVELSKVDLALNFNPKKLTFPMLR